MMLIPNKGKLAIAPILRSELEAAELKQRSGLLLPPPDNKRERFEALPNIGRVFALPYKYRGELKVGDQIIFSEMKPNGIKWEDMTLFILRLEQIIGIIPGELAV